MKEIEAYHHFKKDYISPDDRVTRCERYVIDLLLQSSIPDSDRESSVAWELKHQASVVQFARILALKRGLPTDICILGMLLHDIYSVVQGKYSRHAHLGTPIAEKILSEVGKFSKEESDQIIRIVRSHSDKHIWSDDPFQEFGKDVDVLDCFLYEGAFNYYLKNKPLPIFKEYLKRARLVWRELGLPPDPRFNLLIDYGPSWFECIREMPLELLSKILAVILELSQFNKNIGICPESFCIVVGNSKAKFCASRNAWAKYGRLLGERAQGCFESNIGEALVNMLNWFLGEKTDLQQVNQYCLFLERVFVSRKILEEGKRLLQQGEDLESYSLVFWPLIDVFEFLKGEALTERLEDFGVDLISRFEGGNNENAL